MKVNFKSSKGIIEELENAVSAVVEDRQSIELAKVRVTGCKHAIQVFALAMEYARMNNLRTDKLKAVELEEQKQLT